MPVPGCEDAGASRPGSRYPAVQDRDHAFSLGDRQRAPRTEIVLNIDNEQSIESVEFGKHS